MGIIMNQGLGKNFWIYFGIMFSSAFVDNILKNSIIVYALFNSVVLWGLSSESIAPVAAGLFILPFLLFSAASGQWSDQEDKKIIVIICKALELLIGILVLYLFPKEQFAWLIACLFILGLHSTLFGPAKYSMIKDLVTPDKFILATAWVEAGTFISILIGTIGGAMLASYRVMDNLGVGIVMIACSSIAFSLSFFLPKFPKAPKESINFNPITASLAVIKQSRSLPKLDTVIHQISWFYFLATYLVTMMPAIVKNDFKLSEHMVSWVYALFIVGVALGSFIYEKLSKHEINLSPMFSSMWMVFWFLLASAIILPYAASQPFLIFALGILFCLALVLGVFSTPLYALLQRLPPKEWQSQAVATNNIVNAVYMIAASILQILLYHLNFSHAAMFYVLALSWLWAKRSMFKNFSYDYIHHLVSSLTNLRYKVEIANEAVLPTSGPVIIISNHVSFIDWAFLARMRKEQIRFVMWYFYYKMPILKSMFSAAGAIPIAGRREDLAYFENAFKQMEVALKNREFLLYFPEGGITKNGDIDYFKSGIIEIIKKHQEPITIIPAYLDGLWLSIFSRNPKKWSGFFRRILKRRTITVRLGSPILADGATTKEQLRDLVLSLRP
jgi:1-acyl-sn-glycerol-3-phosphate acyltransferase